MSEHLEETRNPLPTGWRIALWGVAAALLALPVVAMQFTDQVDWDGADFLVMTALLGAVCLGIEQTYRRSASIKTRIGVAAGIIGVFVILWMELAVGFLG